MRLVVVLMLCLSVTAGRHRSVGYRRGRRVKDFAGEQDGVVEFKF